MRERRDENIGWYGMLLVLTANGLVSVGAIGLDEVPIHALNILGGMGLGWWAYTKGFMRGVIVCGIWVLLGLYGLIWAS